MPVDARTVPRQDVLAALDSISIDGWVVSKSLQHGLLGGGVEVNDLPDRLTRPNSAFRNQIVGRIAERVFRFRHLTPLEPTFKVYDYHERGDNRDYGVSDGELELPINVKTASTRFETAKNYGLDPDDCIPISSYKALNAFDRVPDLVYVDLVDFTLRQRADVVMDGLVGPLGILWDLFTWYAGKGAKAAQDRFVDQVFLEHGTDLDALAPGATSFRVISARRVLAILRENPRRCPGLGVKAAGTGTFVAEVNVHVSVAQETKPWDDVEKLLMSDGLDPVLELIRQTEEREVPAPAL